MGEVEDVRLLAVVVLVAMVHAPTATRVDRARITRSIMGDDAPHQIKKVAGLFHERASGPLIKSIPVRDLVEERESMFPNSDHLRRT